MESNNGERFIIEEDWRELGVGRYLLKDTYNNGEVLLGSLDKITLMHHKDFLNQLNMEKEYWKNEFNKLNNEFGG